MFVCLFSHTSICRRHFEHCVPLTWGWVVAERRGWGGRFPAGCTAEAAGNSLCFILLAAKGSEDGDGVEHDSCLNHIPPPWRGILLFLVVYCAGQGVRRVFVARAGQGREARLRVAGVSGTCIIDPPLKAFPAHWAALKMIHGSFPS